jgi:hypothetical protein
MTKTSSFFALLASTLLALLLAAPPASAQTPEPPAPAATEPSAASTPPPAECLPSCRAGYVCLNGTCVSACNPPCGAGQRCEGTGQCVAEPPPPAPAAAPPPAAAPIATGRLESYGDSSRPQRSPSADSHVNVNVNVLGLLQLGMVPGIEVGGRNFGLTARVRLMQTGLLSHLVLADPNDDEVFASGYGLGLVARYYTGFGGNMRGFYVGAGLEYVSTRIEDTTDDMEAYDTTLLIPELDIGYRWVWGHFLLEVGGSAGYTLVQSATSEDLSGDEDAYVYPNETEDTLYVMGVVGIGWFF